MRRLHGWLLVLVLISAAGYPRPASATFSIVACEAEGGTCGVAVATNNLAVGASVCYAEAGVGALVSQFETNPRYGPDGLRWLADGLDAQATLARLLADDGNFEGLGIGFRQVGIVRAQGQGAVHTGEAVLASPWAGSRVGPHYTIQGNGLAGEAVVLAMEAAFLNAPGPLAERLVAALTAGQRAGGQATGTLSAAVLVRTPQGWPFDIDLRVDADEAPVASLNRLLDLHYARQAIIRAERLARQGETDQAWTAVAEALHRGARWDRVWRRAARLAIALDEPARALEYLGVFMALNPAWARSEIEEARYAPLHDNPLFRSWQERP
ncbi:MAG: DUF1028 domain-containing protein [Bacteroidota bacterium]